MSMTGYWRQDPFASLRALQQDLERVFEQPGRTAASGRFPPVNLWAGPDSVAVTLEVPGVEPDGLELSVKDDVLTVSGAREDVGPEDAAAWHRHERQQGRFRRVIQLPFRVDPERVTARCREGVLEVDLQRPEADRPRRIDIQQH